MDRDYKRQIILITDAAVQDNGKLTKLIKEKYKNAPRSASHVPDPNNRFFVLGLGSGVSKSLCEDMSKAGGGIAAFFQADELHNLSGKGLLNS